MDGFYLIILILVAFLGLSVGSFLNVVILRFDDIESVIKTRSHCLKCRKILPWYDLIPFFSYLILVGRCRHCKKNISIQYPIVEALTAIIFVLIFWRYGLSVESLFLGIISCLLIVVAVFDWLHSEIPDILIYSAAIFTVGLISYSLWQTQDLLNSELWLSYLYGLVIGLVFFGFLVVISRQKWMGAGDILLGSLMGLILGYPSIIVALFLAFLIGSLFSLILMAAKQKKLKDAIPFGPFLVLAIFITFFWGEIILNIYLIKFGL